MAEIISLRKARKNKRRVVREKQAHENRIRFGQSKRQRNAQTAEREHAERMIDGHRRETTDHEPTDS
jgi:hypothetical protein